MSSIEFIFDKVRAERIRNSGAWILCIFLRLLMHDSTRKQIVPRKTFFRNCTFVLSQFTFTIHYPSGKYNLILPVNIRLQFVLFYNRGFLNRMIGTQEILCMILFALQKDVRCICVAWYKCAPIFFNPEVKAFCYANLLTINSF